MENVQTVNSASQQKSGTLYKFMRLGMAILAMVLTLVIFIGMAVGLASAAGVSLNIVSIIKYALRIVNMGMGTDAVTYVMFLSYACVYVAFLIVILVMFIKAIISFIKYMTKFTKTDAAVADACTASYNGLLKSAFVSLKFAVILILLCRMFASPVNGLAVAVLVLGTMAFALYVAMEHLFADGKFVITVPGTIFVLVKKLLLPVMFVYIIGACIHPCVSNLCDGCFAMFGGRLAKFDDSMLVVFTLYTFMLQPMLYMVTYIIAISMINSFIIPLPPAEGKKPANYLKKFIVMLVFFVVTLIADIALGIMAGSALIGGTMGDAVSTWIGPILVSVAGIVLYAGLKGLNDSVELPAKAAAAPEAAPSVENAEPPVVQEPAPEDIDEHVKEGEGLPPETEEPAAEAPAEEPAAADDKVVCGNCGAANDAGSKFCFSCGNKLHD